MISVIKHLISINIKICSLIIVYINIVNTFTAIRSREKGADATKRPWWLSKQVTLSRLWYKAYTRHLQLCQFYLRQFKWRNLKYLTLQVHYYVRHWITTRQQVLCVRTALAASICCYETWRSAAYKSRKLSLFHYHPPERERERDEKRTWMRENEVGGGGGWGGGQQPALVLSAPNLTAVFITTAITPASYWLHNFALKLLFESVKYTYKETKIKVKLKKISNLF